jgi:tetratricopeptide (TPR) repeat protein
VSVSSKSLAPAAPVAPIAESLEDAMVGMMLYVDARGQVRPSEQYRRSVVLGVGGSVLAMAFYTAALTFVGGPIGFAVAGVFNLLVVRNLAAWRTLYRATALQASRQIAQSETLLIRLVGRRLTPYRIKANAEQALARIAVLRGRYDQALVLQSSAVKRLSRDRRARSRRRMIEYERTVTLINLGRFAEARQRFDDMPRVLEGDYLRIQRTVAELYLCFGENRHQFDPAFLQEQADIALGMQTAPVLLVLLAWAQVFAGHDRRAAELLTLARDRPGHEAMRKLYPRACTWMDAF